MWIAFHSYDLMHTTPLFCNNQLSVFDSGGLGSSCVTQEYGRYGAQSLEEKQKLFKLVKSIGSGAESASESSIPPVFSFSASQSGMDGYFPPELRGDFNAGILDLHSIDDTEFFPEVILLNRL